MKGEGQRGRRWGNMLTVHWSDHMLPVRPGAVDPHVSGREAHRAVEQWH